MQPNGQSAERKIVATFGVAIDDAGNCQTRMEGAFPIMPLYLALGVAQSKLLDQLKMQEMQQHMAAQQKRVLMPDGTPPPPGL